MSRLALPALALAFLLAHVWSLPQSLEDIDSVNFALGIRDFDVATHRPHPPGYPIYIALGKLGVAIATPLGGTTSRSAIEARTLATLSLIAALTAIWLLYRVVAAWSTVDGDATGRPRAIAATALAIACPLFWFMSVRPMSDMPGLAAALVSQGLLAWAWRRQQPDSSGDRRLTPDRMAASGRLIVLGALAAGIAIGFRSQNAVLTLPLLAGVWIDRLGRGAAGALLGGGVTFTAGVLAWAVPLIVASGGLSAYLAALGSQAGEDFAGVDMIYLDPTNVRLIATALWRTFVTPWESVPLAVVVLSAAAVGAGLMAWRDLRTLTVIGLASGPYLLFHVLFQDTVYTRYALPLVPATTYLAVYGLERVLGRAMLPATALLAATAVALATPVLNRYGSELSPTARAVLALSEAQRITPPGALAMHQTFRRPLEAEALTIEPTLPSPPRREWLELAKYWRAGETSPIWFLADPRRSDLALLDPRSRDDRTEFTWSFTSLSQIGGMRPEAVSWYRIAAPGWFAEEGWALTPETAGMAGLMGRGPSHGPITAWVRRRPEAARAIVGGRHLGAESDPVVRVVVRLDGRELAAWDAAPGFFLQEIDLPAGALMGEGSLAALTVETLSPSESRIETAIEQFDLQSAGTMMWAYDTGWQEAEYAPRLGVWRWTAGESVLRIVDASRPVTVTLHVEDPLRYFDARPTVHVRAGSRVLGETTFADATVWSVDVPLDALRASGGRLTIVTDRTFAPADRGRSRDQRQLGLRVFAVRVASQP